MQKLAIPSSHSSLTILNKENNTNIDFGNNISLPPHPSSNILREKDRNISYCGGTYNDNSFCILILFFCVNILKQSKCKQAYI